MQLNYHILIVDDVADNIQIAMSILKEENYNFSFATSGEAALELLEENDFDLLLLDVMMPGMDGYEVCERMHNDPRFLDIPIIFLTAKADIDSIAKGFAVGGVDYIVKPFHADELLARVKTHLELYSAKKTLQFHNINLREKVQYEEKRLLSELEANQKEMIYIMTELMEQTSDETGRHIRRVAEFSRLLAHYYPALNEEDANVIFHAAPMHDIGKMMIPLPLLNKVGRLNEDEFLIMQTHTTIGHSFLRHSSRKILKAADIIAHQHHEKWNGKGYPQGLKGEDIHIFGRIVALADVFDALVHKRVYKEAWSMDEAVVYIREHSGTQFDPKLVDIFIENIDEFLSIEKF